VRTAASLAQMHNGARVKVAGIVTSRQRPQTASGVTFVTLEDETGFLNLVVWPAISARQPRMVREARLLGVAGTLQISEGVVHVIAGELVDLSPWLAQMSLRSRDFC
jgi:error-prone DNA polymerase